MAEDQVERYFNVTVYYATENGNPGAWRGDVLATWDTVHDVGKAAAKKARPWIGKVNGSDTNPYPEGYVPSQFRGKKK